MYLFFFFFFFFNIVLTESITRDYLLGIVRIGSNLRIVYKGLKKKKKRNNNNSRVYRVASNSGLSFTDKLIIELSSAQAITFSNQSIADPRASL